MSDSTYASGWAIPSVLGAFFNNYGLIQLRPETDVSSDETDVSFPDSGGVLSGVRYTLSSQNYNGATINLRASSLSGLGLCATSNNRLFLYPLVTYNITTGACGPDSQAISSLRVVVPPSPSSSLSSSSAIMSPTFSSVVSSPSSATSPTSAIQLAISSDPVSSPLPPPTSPASATDPATSLASASLGSCSVTVELYVTRVTVTLPPGVPAPGNTNASSMGMGSSYGCAPVTSTTFLI